MTDDDSPRPHPLYGTCGGCRQLKHVRPDGRMRVHNRFTARGTAVTSLRCGGSGLPSLEQAVLDEALAQRRSA